MSAPGTIARAAWAPALAAALAMAGCGADDAPLDAVYLSVTSAEPLDTVALAYRDASGDAPALWADLGPDEVVLALTDVDSITTDAYVVRVVAGEVATGPSWLIARGFSGGVVVVRAVLRIALDAPAEVAIHLEPVECVDADADGFCADEDAPWTDCDDSDRLASPLGGCAPPPREGP